MVQCVVGETCWTFIIRADVVLVMQIRWVSFAGRNGLQSNIQVSQKSVSNDPYSFKARTLATMRTHYYYYLRYV